MAEIPPGACTGHRRVQRALSEQTGAVGTSNTITRVAVVNAMGSVRNRMVEITRLFAEENLSCLAVTEAGCPKGRVTNEMSDLVWLGCATEGAVRERASVGWLVRSDIPARLIRPPPDGSSHCWIELILGGARWALCVTYFKHRRARLAGSSNEKTLQAILKDLHALKIEGYRCAVVGDFNAHVSRDPEGGIGAGLDVNGKLLKELCVEGGLSVANFFPDTIGSVTWQRDGLSSTIDFILVDDRSESEVSSVVVDELGKHDTNSDHNLICFSILGPLRGLNRRRTGG